MALLSLLILTTVCLCADSALNATNCGQFKCPEFTIDFTENGFEKRFYKDAVWMKASAVGSFKNATSDISKRLKNYMSGTNEKNVSIPISIPIVTMMWPTGADTVLDNFTQFVFIEPMSTPAPEPTDKSITKTEVSPKHMFIRSIPSAVKSVQQWLTEAKKLKNAINDETKYWGSFFFAAEYNIDSPNQDSHYNEVWFYAL